MSYYYSYKQKGKKNKIRLVLSVCFLLLIGISILLISSGFSFENLDLSNLQFDTEKIKDINFVELKKINAELDTRPKGLYSGEVCEYSNKRPITLTVSSDNQARPTMGLKQADMVFEVPSTYFSGKHTRLLALFNCNIPEKVRSIRSGRKYFADFTMAMDGVLGHWGQSAEGEKYFYQLESNGDLDHLNAMILGSNAGFTRYWQGTSRLEDTGTANLIKAYEYLSEKNIRLENNFEGYSFLKEKEIEEYKTGKGGKLSINFSSVMDSVYYNYNPEKNEYERFWGGIKDVDALTNEQIAPKNVIIMETLIQSQSDPHYVYITTTGSGKATFYQNGKVFNGTWERKDNNHSKLSFYMADRTELKLVPGQTWIEVVEKSNKVSWE